MCLLHPIFKKSLVQSVTESLEQQASYMFKTFLGPMIPLASEVMGKAMRQELVQISL